MKQSYIMPLSETYKLMIHFAHSTMTIYQNSVRCYESMSINDFRNANQEVIVRVHEDCKQTFHYELDYAQISRAIELYFQCKFRPKDAK